MVSQSMKASGKQWWMVGYIWYLSWSQPSHVLCVCVCALVLLATGCLMACLVEAEVQQAKQPEVALQGGWGSGAL
jgi:hypothetical protein